MKTFLAIAILRVYGFVLGMRIALDWWYLIAFDRKLPRWLAWLIGIAFVPVNVIIVVVALVARIATWKELTTSSEEIVYQVADAE